MRLLSPAARAARQAKASNKKVLGRRVIPAKPDWLGGANVQEGLPVERLDDLSPESRAKLAREAQEQLLFRIRGNKNVKLSATFAEAADALGIDEAHHDAVLKTVFAYAMDRYRTPNTGKPLSALKHSVLKVLIEEDHTSPFEIAVHDPEHWGRRSNNSFTSRVTEWGHLDKISEPVQIQTHKEDDAAYSNGVPFTYYYLSAEFKKQVIRDAVEWDAQLSSEIQDLIHS